ncbi:MAG: CDP-alcohol phosphatidyltransferase family protein [Oscillospiraceae bacterium]|nr:CDP-alcohol phosphatidyltransferase family protein [Oscillospiraceae bacterium]
MKLKDVNWKNQLTIPNGLTVLRLLLVPVMAYYIYHIDEYGLTGFYLFLAIWLTDILDGFIARHFNQISDLGKVLDPLVDKIFQLTTGVMLFIIGRLPFWVPLILLAKEILMIIGGSFLFKRQDVVVKSEWYGKLTTVLLVIAFSVALIIPTSKLAVIPWLFIGPVGFAIFAFIRYAYYYWPSIKKH